MPLDISIIQAGTRLAEEEERRKPKGDELIFQNTLSGYEEQINKAASRGEHYIYDRLSTTIYAEQTYDLKNAPKDVRFGDRLMDIFTWQKTCDKYERLRNEYFSNEGNFSAPMKRVVQTLREKGFRVELKECILYIYW